MQKRNFVTPRHIAMYLLLKNTNLTLKGIGEIFNRDHTTVINARVVIENYKFCKDENIIHALTEIQNNLRVN